MQSVAYTFLYIRCEALYYLNGENAWGSKLFDTPSYMLVFISLKTGVILYVNDFPLYFCLQQYLSHTGTMRGWLWRALASVQWSTVCWFGQNLSFESKTPNMTQSSQVHRALDKREKLEIIRDNFCWFCIKPMLWPLIWTGSMRCFRWGVTTYVLD